MKFRLFLHQPAMSDRLSTKPYKGSRDFFPPEMRSRDWAFSVLSNTVESFGFEKIDAPILEPIEIYLAKTSQEIVEQQMYSFTDRGDRQVAMRPEMTPTVSRMVAAQLRETPRPIRWYSLPNLWRYERPGKGRLREHWQLNCDVFGAHDQDMADLELIQLAANLLLAFGADKSMFAIRLNHRSWLNFVLVDLAKLSPELTASVARVMDKKEKVSPGEYAKLLQEAGCTPAQVELIESYSSGSLDFLNKYAEAKEAQALLKLLKAIKDIGLDEYVVYDPTIIRGFDYYTGMVFEVNDLHPDNRRSLFGGGRYDNLVGLFSKESINACGFGMGDVTLFDFLQTHDLLKQPSKQTDVYVAWFPEPQLQTTAFKITALLRKSGLRVEQSLGPAKLGKQFEEAQKKSARFVVVCGSNELEKNIVVIKDMSTGDQKEVGLSEVEQSIKNNLPSV